MKEETKLEKLYALKKDLFPSCGLGHTVGRDTNAYKDMENALTTTETKGE